jgi:hypothetical protein
MAAPYDESDPFIFHSINGLAAGDQIKFLVAQNAVLASKKDIAEGKAPVWRGVLLSDEGDVSDIDVLAGDNKYVFMTPGYIYQDLYPVLAYRMSTIRKLTAFRYRFFSLIGLYRDLEKALKGLPNRFAQMHLSGLAESETLNSFDSPWFTKEYNRVVIGRNGGFTENANRILDFYIKKNERIMQAFESTANIYKTAADYLTEFKHGKHFPSEILCLSQVPVSAAEMYYDNEDESWHSMAEITGGNKLSGLGSLFLADRHKVLIPGWKRK